MRQLALYWLVTLFASTVLAFGTVLLTITHANVPSHNNYTSESESNALPPWQFILIALGLTGVALLTFAFNCRWASKPKNHPRRFIRYGHLVLTIAMMSLGLAVGFLIADQKLGEQSKQITSAYNAEVAARQQALANAPQQCASELAASPSVWALEPCASCLMPQASYLPAAYSWWLVNTQLGGSAYNQQTFVTKLEPLDAIVCSEQLNGYSEGVWSSFSTMNISQSEPQCLNIQLDWQVPIGQALIAYAAILDVWVPMQTTVQAVVTSSGDCVQVQGTASRRFYLDAVCGMVNNGLPNPLRRGSWPVLFSNCSSPAFVQFQVNYAARIEALEFAITNVSTPFVYDQNTLWAISGVVIATAGCVIVVLVILMIVAAIGYDQEREPIARAYAPEYQPPIN